MSWKIPTAVKFHFFSFLKDLFRVGSVIAVITLIALILFYHVANQVKITRLGYRIAEVTSEHRRLIEENKKLTIEAAVQGRTERITDVAQGEFGLHSVRPDQVKKLPKSLIQELDSKISVSDDLDSDDDDQVETPESPMNEAVNGKTDGDAQAGSHN